MIVATLLAVVIATGKTQDCGPYAERPNQGSVTYWGESADNSRVGFGDCTGSAWIGDTEIYFGNGAPEFYRDGLQVGPDWNGNAS